MSVHITEHLVRSKSEHNEGMISTLEELSLHQLDIVKIEHLGRWSPKLQILYLQGNLISKLENLNRLKEMNYLNVAMNNIEKIEGLSQCEYLEKLDLTMNFVRVLSNLEEELGPCIFLRDLYLTGNPCTQFPNYRDYVIAAVPQITRLDGTEITKTERIKAQQVYNENHKEIRYAELDAEQDRGRQKREFAEKRRNMPAMDPNIAPEDDPYWNEVDEFTPESRVEQAEYMRMKNEQKNKSTSTMFKEPKLEKREVKFYDKGGIPLNVNEAKIPFEQTETDQHIILTVCTYKAVTTEDLDVDLKPTHVKIMIKARALQLVFFEEIVPAKSKAERSEITGYLTLTLHKKKYNPKVKHIAPKPQKLTKPSEQEALDDLDDLPPLI